MQKTRLANGFRTANTTWKKESKVRDLPDIKTLKPKVPRLLSWIENKEVSEREESSKLTRASSAGL